MAYKTQVTGYLPSQALEVLKNSKNLEVIYSPEITNSELELVLGDISALVIRTNTKITAELLKKAPKLSLVVRAGVGLDNVDLEACKARNIEVRNTPRANIVSAAEHTFGLILSLARMTPQATKHLKGGGWDRNQFTGVELQNKTLGIIGFGNIGSKVAKYAEAFSMKVLANDIVPKENIKLVSLSDLLKSSDFVTMHVPLTPETRAMANEGFFNKMKKGSFFINASRGAVVVEEELLKALNEGHLRGSALDVFNNEPIERGSGLLTCEKIILTPHTAGQTTESQNNMGLEAAQIVCQFFIKG